MLSLLLPVYTHRWDFTMAKRRKSYHDPLTLIVWRRWWRRWRGEAKRSRHSETTCLGFARHGSNYKLNNGAGGAEARSCGFRSHYYTHYQTAKARRGVYYNDRAGKFFGSFRRNPLQPRSSIEKARPSRMEVEETDKREDTENRS